MRTANTIVVFDFDGTLVLSNRIKHDAFAWTAAAYGLDTAALADIRVGMPAANRHAIFAAFSRRLAEDGGERVPAGATLAATYGEFCTHAIAACPWVPGAEQALDRLATRGIAVFINSATPQDGLESALRARGIAHRFAGVFGAPQSKLDNLAQIARETECPPRAMVMVGDGEDDRYAAERFGCHFVGVALPDDRHGRPNHPFRQTPSTTLADLSTLPSMIEDLVTTQVAVRP